MASLLVQHLDQGEVTERVGETSLASAVGASFFEEIVRIVRVSPIALVMGVAVVALDQLPIPRRTALTTYCAAAIWSSRITYGVRRAKIGIVANRFADSVHAILAYQALFLLIYALCVHAVLASRALRLVIDALCLHTILASGAL